MPTTADESNSVKHGFIHWENGVTKKPIDAPNSFDTDLNGVNDKGHMVGTNAAKDAMGLRLDDHCFIRENENEVELFDVLLPNVTAPDCSGINNRGDTVGAFTDAITGFNHGWFRDDDDGNFKQLDFPGALGTEAFGINDGRDIVGLYLDANGFEHGFLLDRGVYSTIDFPGSVDTNAFGINSHDEIVGSYSTDGQVDHGFLRKRNGTFVTVDVTLPDAADTNGVHGISSEGWMVGIYTDNNGRNQAFITREPK